MGNHTYTQEEDHKLKARWVEGETKRTLINEGEDPSVEHHFFSEQWSLSASFIDIVRKMSSRRTSFCRSCHLHATWQEGEEQMHRPAEGEDNTSGNDGKRRREWHWSHWRMKRREKHHQDSQEGEEQTVGKWGRDESTHRRGDHHQNLTLMTLSGSGT